MNTDSPTGPIALPEALVLWTTPALVEAVRTEERKLLPFHVHEFYRLTEKRLQLCPDDELQKPSRNGGWAGPPDLGNLVTAWRALERDFRQRLTRGAFYLSGIQTRPEPTTEPKPIPGVWAADCQFDFQRDVIAVHNLRFVAVIASREILAPQPPAGTADRAAPQDPLSPEATSNLDPDTVAALLEAHADHVRRSLRIALLPPGKASPIALAATMMQHRARTNALYATLQDEAEWLEAWLKVAAPSYFPVGAKRLSNMLGRVYADLKAGGDGRLATGNAIDG